MSEKMKRFIGLILVPVMALAAVACSITTVDPDRSGRQTSGPSETAAESVAPTSSPAPGMITMITKCRNTESVEVKTLVLDMLMRDGYHVVKTDGDKITDKVLSGEAFADAAAAADCTSEQAENNSDIRLYKIKGKSFLCIENTLYLVCEGGSFYLSNMCMWDYDNNGVKDVVFCEYGGSGVGYGFLWIFDVTSKKTIRVRASSTLSDVYNFFKFDFDGTYVYVDGSRLVWDRNAFVIEGKGPVLCDGAYFISGDDALLQPYIMLFYGSFKVVKDIAVSFQPFGKSEIVNGDLILKGTWFDGEFCLVFTILTNDSIRFDLARSDLTEEMTLWEDGTVLKLFTGGDLPEYGSTDVTKMNDAQKELYETYPEYFGLNYADGLDVLVWQMSGNSYSFALYEGSYAENAVFEWLLNARGVNLNQIKEILGTYSNLDGRINIIPYQHPLSSYLPEWCIKREGVDSAAVKEQYIENIRKMLTE